MSHLLATIITLFSLPSEIQIAEQSGDALKGQAVAVTLTDNQRLRGTLQSLNDGGRVVVAVEAGSSRAIYSVSRERVKQIEIRVEAPVTSTKTMAELAHEALFGH